MLIDFHTHTFPDKIAPAAMEKLSKKANLTPYTDGTLQGLMDSMEKEGVDVAVVLPVATDPSQVEHINRRALEINYDTFDTGVFSFGAMHPDYTDYKKELKWLADNGFRGIKLHPDYQKHYVNDTVTKNIIAEAESLGLYTTLHAGIDIGYPSPVHCPPTLAAEMVDELHPEHVILAHTGGWNQWDEVIEHLTDKHLFFDISFSFGKITDEQFIKILNQHSSKKLLFATDSPWDNATDTLNALKKLPLTQSQLDDICYKNACRILSI